MAGFPRLFMPRRRKNREEVAGRAAEVIVHVLFDVGADRFLNGNMLLDRQFRLRFFSAPAAAARDALAVIDMADLAEARALRASLAGSAFDTAAMARLAGQVADGLMRELLARSPELRALPPKRLGGVFASR